MEATDHLFENLRVRNIYFISQRMCEKQWLYWVVKLFCFSTFYIFCPLEISSFLQFSYYKEYIIGEWPMCFSFVFVNEIKNIT
jgi:hypothetical protein